MKEIQQCQSNINHQISLHSETEADKLCPRVMSNQNFKLMSWMKRDKMVVVIKNIIEFVVNSIKIIKENYYYSINVFGIIG